MTAFRTNWNYFEFARKYSVQISQTVWKNSTLILNVC